MANSNEMVQKHFLLAKIHDGRGKKYLYGRTKPWHPHPTVFSGVPAYPTDICRGDCFLCLRFRYICYMYSEPEAGPPESPALLKKGC